MSATNGLSMSVKLFSTSPGTRRRTRKRTTMRKYLLYLTIRKPVKQWGRRIVV